MQIKFAEIDAKDSGVLHCEGCASTEEVDDILDAAETEYLNMLAIVQYEICRKYLPKLALMIAGEKGEASYVLKLPSINDLYYT